MNIANMGSIVVSLGREYLASARSVLLNQNKTHRSTAARPISMKRKVSFAVMASASSLRESEESSQREAISGLGIVEFLKGKCLLVTGATGFLGKVFVEKILRVAPDVGKIYLLIQAKNTAAARTRLNAEVIGSEVFKVLRETHGENFEELMKQKLFAVAGTVSEADLGISPEIIGEITSAVEVIVHSAANTTFDERYDISLDINMEGTRRMMNMARKCEKLELFVHVSSAYVNGTRKGRIYEKAFFLGDSIASETSKTRMSELDIEAEMRLLLKLRETGDGNNLQQSMKDLGLARAAEYGWHDTYTFTKAMGEMMVNSMRGDIPLIILRPSIIESTLREPFPGFIEGIRMIDPIILLYGKGRIPGFLGGPEVVLDVVPADMVVNMALAAMAKHSGESGIHTFHVASSTVNPLIIRDFAAMISAHFQSHPIVETNGRKVIVSRFKLFLEPEEFFLHLASSSSSRSEIFFNRLKQLLKIYKPYVFYEARFDNTNTTKLLEEMSSEEQRVFGFNVGEIQWEDYFCNIHIPGLRRQAMKGRG